MSTSVTMPALGESVSEGTVTRWLKQEGDQVNADEPLLEVSTDKVDTEIPSPASGVLTKIIVAEDETVEVGAELAIIGDGSADGGGGDAAGEQQAAPQQDAPQQEAQQGKKTRRRTPASKRHRQQETPRSSKTSSKRSSRRSRRQWRQQQAAPADGGSGGGTSVTMPALGESVTEGTVTRWLKQEGDQVNADEPLLEVSTDKVDTEIPSPASGVLTKIIVAEDETVEVGAELALIGGGSGGGDAAQQAGAGAGPAGAARPAGGQHRKPPPRSRSGRPATR